jgi:hypothetical protein
MTAKAATRPNPVLTTPTVIQPRLARRVAFAAVPVLLNLTTICGVSWSGSSALPIAVTVVSVLACAALYLVSLRPRITFEDDLLRVRNMWRTHQVRRRQIGSLTYSGRQPWPHVVLTDGTTIAAQAIHRWDGEHAIAAARALQRWHRPPTAR